MPKKGQTQPKRPIGDPSDPAGFGVRVAEYLDHLRIKGYAERTVAAYQAEQGAVPEYAHHSVILPRYLAEAQALLAP